MMNDFQEEDRLATGSESLREFAFNAGMDNPDRCWLLDGRDVWVRNPFYRGPEQPHPEDDDGRPQDPYMNETPLGHQIEEGGEIEDLPF